jgi:hypothetical protein
LRMDGTTAMPGMPCGTSRVVSTTPAMTSLSSHRPAVGRDHLEPGRQLEHGHPQALVICRDSNFARLSKTGITRTG